MKQVLNVFSPNCVFCVDAVRVTDVGSKQVGVEAEDARDGFFGDLAGADDALEVCDPGSSATLVACMLPAMSQAS